MDKWKSKVVLVVEDSSVQRAHLVELLKSLNFGFVLEACNGVDALRVLTTRELSSVDLVVTDLDMPHMDGIELITHLSERQLTKQLIVTSARDPRMLEVVEKMGLDDVGMHLLGTLVKPIKFNDLMNILERADHTPGQIPSHPAATLDRSRFNLDELEAALKRDQFICYYQPKVDMSTGLVNGVEALARWQHPEFGLLSPLHFIPRMEGSTLMEPFTLSIVEQVFGEIKRWSQLGLASLKVSINLSAENLEDTAFIDQLINLTAGQGIEPHSIVWEVTETMVMSNLSKCLGNMVRLRLKGFGLAMDDYGIGYSSMQQLSRCPFTELKIDRAFVDGASERSNRLVILESSINIGKRMEVITVAEGVEALADWKLLQKIGCNTAQGYIIAKPMPAVEFPGWEEKNRERLQDLVKNDDPVETKLVAA